MTQRRPFLAGVVAVMAVPELTMAVDFVRDPVPSETFVSKNGAYAFDIVLAQRWRTEDATGQLFALGADGKRQPIWQRQLPQRVRPRFALVADDGTVALFDQFDNVKGPIAVQVIDPRGHDRVRLSFDDLARALGVTDSEMHRQARYGAWMQSLPVLMGPEIHVGVAGQTLALDLGNGRVRSIQ